MTKRPRRSSSNVAGDNSHGATDRLTNDPTEAPSKIVHVEGNLKPVGKIQCDLPPHEPLQFATYDEYEVHYGKTHLHRCIECHKNLPTDHFLSLHIAENHDPINAAKKDRGDKTYACFLEDCDRVCSTWQKRRMHLVDKHGFSRDYDFFVVNDGMDGRKSMLRQDRTKSQMESRSMANTSPHQQPVMERHDDSFSDDAGVVVTPALSGVDGLDELTSGMASLKFVPNSVRFGRKKGLPGFSKT